MQIKHYIFQTEDKLLVLFNIFLCFSLFRCLSVFIIGHSADDLFDFNNSAFGSKRSHTKNKNEKEKRDNSYRNGFCFIERKNVRADNWNNKRSTWLTFYMFNIFFCVRALNKLSIVLREILERNELLSSDLIQK